MDENYDAFRILYLLEKIGEDTLSNVLSDFSCEYQQGVHNIEVERSLHNNAIDFSKKKISITYLAVDNKKDNFVGYFTLVHRPLSVPLRVVQSSTLRRRMERYARLDEKVESYNVSAFLIAQSGKNYNLPKEDQISGTDLMNLAFSVIRLIQKMIGGGVVFWNVRIIRN